LHDFLCIYSTIKVKKKEFRIYNHTSNSSVTALLLPDEYHVLSLSADKKPEDKGLKLF